MAKRKKATKKKATKKKPAKKKTARKGTKKKTARKKTKAAKKPARRKATKAKRPTKKKPAKRKTKAKAKKTTKRKPNAAFMRPLTPSAALGVVIGTKPLPRTEVTKKLWHYIKKNNLQDAVERRFINADAPLKVVFGGKGRINMFEMTKHVSKHLK